MTEKEKMIKGLIYDAYDEELNELRSRCRRLMADLAAIEASDQKGRETIYEALLGGYGRDVYVLNAAFDYGFNTYLGDDFSANFNFTVLDCAPVRIGNNVLIGPNVSLVTPVHSLLAEERNIVYDEDGGRHLYEYARPITIEDSVWIASNVVVQGGVTIGEGAVISAGAVVTKDIPPYSIAGGVPARVLRTITEDDSLRGTAVDAGWPEH